MGMSIDEHKEHLLDIMDSMPDDACGDWRDSLAYAIDTMRKYQKIVDIVSLNDEEFKQCGLKELKEILEVIADGNDD